MMKKLFAVGALALAAGVAAIPAASADPVGTPTFRPLAGMGSDTTENVMQGLSDVVVIGGAKVIGSYNATPAGQVVNTKAEADQAGRCNTAGGSGGVPRANGSSAGRDALLAAMTSGSTTFGCLDFARTSSGAIAAGQTFVTMASDGLSYAYPTGGDIGAQAALADLQAIYQCTVPGFQPLIPQSGSGTRNSWATLMGISNTTLPACVKDTIGGLPIQEHNGAIFSASNQMVPFSVAQWISQASGVVSDSRAGAQLGGVDGSYPLVQNTTQAILRQVGNILPTTVANDTTSLGHKVFINDGSGKSAICTQGKATIQKYGFVPVNC